MGSGGRPHILGRIIVFSVNFVFWVSGILLIVFGSIALADPYTIVTMLNHIDGVSYVTGIINIVDLLEGVAIFMIVLGCFLFLLGANGCHGVIGKNKRSIMLYMLWLLVSVVLELALIIYASVYPKLTSTETWIQDTMAKSLNNTFHPVTVNSTTGAIKYAAEQDLAFNWQRLQFQTKCCGAASYTDYTKIPKNSTLWTFAYANKTYKDTILPPSCCRTNLDRGLYATNFIQIYNPTACLVSSGTPSEYNGDACWLIVSYMHWQFDVIAICISCCLIAAQILGLLFSIPLWKQRD